MRIIISLLLIFSTILTFSQRVSFEDPDLTFSFKKPKSWQVFDDGYVVKVSPSVADSASIYFTITYFENAQPFGSWPTATPASKTSENTDFTTVKIAGENARKFEESIESLSLNRYQFTKYGQQFVLKTSSTSPKTNRIFRKIIRSIKILK